MLILNLILSLVVGAQAHDQKDLMQWRQDREQRLKAEEGWLTVVGLDWLKEGENSVGSAFDSDVGLPSGGPKKLGSLNLKEGQVSLTLSSAKGVKIDGRPAKQDKVYELKTDADEKYTAVTYGDVKFYIIKRKNGLGVRIKDNNSKARRKFRGLNWYPGQEEMVVKAKWIPYKKPKVLMVPDILGNVNEEEALGFVEFQLAGETRRLYPSGGPDKLFFVFKDETNGTETYKASRFLYTDGPKTGEVILDFNRASNPPCAFTNYATCPRAPKENILKVAIRAGEKKP